MSASRSAMRVTSAAGPKKGCRLQRRGDPSPALLLLDRQALLVFLLDSPAPPDRRAGEPQNGAVGGVDRQRRMDEEPDIGAVADPPEAALALGLIVDLARVLDQKHVPPR